MNEIMKKIEKKTGINDPVGHICNNLSGSEYNSLLLELYKVRASNVPPASVMEEFNKNRFCFPSPFDPVSFKEEEILWLRSAEKDGFKPVQLSPLTPLGTSSSVAFVDQNNIVSATRGTEVVSDATNVLALLAANDIKKNNEFTSYCTTHRHVRGQYFTNPLFSAHFLLFCMVTPGTDEGDYKFEAGQLENHMDFYFRMLRGRFDKGDILLKLFIRENNPTFITKLDDIIVKIKDKTGIDVRKEDKRNDYYETVQFKYFVKYKGDYFDVADGGFVNWTQKLLSNRKQRLLVSASGLELIFRMEKSPLDL